MNVFIRKRGANPLRIAYSKRYINMVTIYNTPLSTTSEKALFGRPGQGFCRHVDFPDAHSLGMSHEKLHSVKKSRQFLTKSVLKAILLKNRVFF